VNIISQLKLVKAREIYEFVMFLTRCVFSVVCTPVNGTRC